MHPIVHQIPDLYHLVVIKKTHIIWFFQFSEAKSHSLYLTISATEVTSLPVKLKDTSAILSSQTTYSL